MLPFKPECYGDKYYCCGQNRYTLSDTKNPGEMLRKCAYDDCGGYYMYYVVKTLANR